MPQKPFWIFSATKIVLLVMTCALIAAMFFPTQPEALEIFKIAYSSIIAFYFGQKIPQKTIEATADTNTLSPPSL